MSKNSFPVRPPSTSRRALAATRNAKSDRSGVHLHVAMGQRKKEHEAKAAAYTKRDIEAFDTCDCLIRPWRRACAIRDVQRTDATQRPFTYTDFI